MKTSFKKVRNRPALLFVTVAIVAFVLTGCEKTIDIELNETEEKLVVEATIENGQAPRVTLTRSINYFSNIGFDRLNTIFVHNADIQVSNGSRTHKLKEYTVALAPGVNIYYYGVDSSSLSTAFAGELDHAYTLRIVSEGKEYNSTTTIPKITKTIDSIYWRQAPAPADTSKAVVIVKATDPPGFGDYIRYYTKPVSEPVYQAPFNSVFDDLFIDGTTYEVQVQPGVDRNSDSAEGDFFPKGDTVQFKLSNIDRATFDFWRTWEYSFAAIGNPFANPARILGNISNGALGSFTGYASQYRTLILR